MPCFKLNFMLMEFNPKTFNIVKATAHIINGDKITILSAGRAKNAIGKYMFSDTPPKGRLVLKAFDVNGKTFTLSIENGITSMSEDDCI